jgi:divalent metal cation (Fe/Co/Zn/Cd) transporter
MPNTKETQTQTSCCGSQTDNDRAKITRLAIWLVVFTLIYNAIESVISLWLGHDAESILLIGFGLDSLIECSASVAVLFRLLIEAQGAAPERVQVAEDFVHRFVGVTFYLLAVFVLYQSGWILWTKQIPHESIYGIMLAVLSLIVMPLIAWFKIRAARRLQSTALEAEAKETLVCAILSLTLLIGLAANAAFGWWWADPVAALLMIPWLIKEGSATFKGEGCCA